MAPLNRSVTPVPAPPILTEERIAELRAEAEDNRPETLLDVPVWEVIALCSAASRLAAVEAENAALKHAAAVALERFGEYFRFYGAEHEMADCPEDDGCECRLVVGVNDAFRALNACPAGESVTAEQRRAVSAELAEAWTDRSAKR